MMMTRVLMLIHSQVRKLIIKGRRQDKPQEHHSSAQNRPLLAIVEGGKIESPERNIGSGVQNQ